MRRVSLIALSLIGCGSATPGPEFGYVPPGRAETADPAPPPAPVATSGQVSCFFGGLYVTPAGEVENHEGELLVKLTYDRAAQTLIEETFGFPLFERWRVTRTISGRRFTMRQDDGAFTGDGDLDGEAGQWSAWRSRTTSADGATRVDAAARLVDGVLVVEENVMAGDGALRHTLRYSLEPIARNACDDMFARAQAAVDEARARAASAGDVP